MDLDMLEIILREAKKLQIKRLDLTPFAGDILTDKNILDKIELIKTKNNQPSKILHQLPCFKAQKIQNQKQTNTIQPTSQRILFKIA